MRHLRHPLVLATLLTGAAAFAQPAPQPPAPRPWTQAEATAPILTGRLQQWLVNPNGEVDGLLLAEGTQVAFPPHLSAQLLQLAKPGDTLQVSGWRSTTLPVMRATGITAGGRSVLDTPPAPGALPAPREPGALSAMNTSGRVSRILYSGRGDAHGVLLDNGMIVRFPPHVGTAVQPWLQRGTPLHARGWGSQGAQGSALEATAMGPTADAMQELFAGPRTRPGPHAGPHAAPHRPHGPQGPGLLRDAQPVPPPAQAS